MTRAICPACRASIALGAAICGRCGLAVRPTCSNCGEALGAGDVACRRCREPIEAPPAPPVPARHDVSSPTTVAVAPRLRVEPDTEPGTVPRQKRSRRAVVVQLLAIALVAGVLVAGGLLALELFAPRSEAPFDLVHRSYPALGFSISSPNTWAETQRDVGGDPAVVFTESEAPHRGVRVVAEPASLAGARETVAAEFVHPAKTIVPIAVTDGLAVDGHAAFRYALNDGDNFVQQWWVDRPGGTFRVEFYGPQSDEREAKQLAQRIIETFAVG